MSRYPMWKVLALDEALEQIIEIEDAGHEVVRYTDYHWKIDGVDVYPSSKKYIKDGVVGEYENLFDLIKH